MHGIVDVVLQSPEQTHLPDHAIRCQKKGLVNSIKDGVPDNVNTHMHPLQEKKAQQR